MKCQNHMKAFLGCSFLICSLIACSYQQPGWESPPGYAFDAPQKYPMPDRLFEISGIAFHENNNLYGIADEQGIIYHIELENKKTYPIKFAKSGDYEDLTLQGDQVFVLRSDGHVFSFTLDTNPEQPAEQAVEYKDVLPKGEYEGVYMNEKNQLYVLCKDCKKTDDEVMQVYVFQVNANELTEDDAFTVDLSKFQAQLKYRKAFRPSGFTQNKTTGEWYIISSINKALVVADANWNIKKVYPLNPTVFGQPEGIAFDAANNLYISNEGDEFRNGNVLKFEFSQSQ